jgi:hypothetical protein
LVSLGRFTPRECEGMSLVIARSEATKQSKLSVCCEMDCFAEPVIGRRFAPTRWLAMTTLNRYPFFRSRSLAEAGTAHYLWDFQK